MHLAQTKLSAALEPISSINDSNHSPVDPNAFEEEDTYFVEAKTASVTLDGGFWFVFLVVLLPKLRLRNDADRIALVEHMNVQLRALRAFVAPLA